MSPGKEKWLLLILILIGLSLRIHNLDLPPVGYHNMKETEYLSEAREFYFHGDYLHRRVAWSGMDSPDSPGYFEEYAQLPVLPWLILAGWKVLGIHVWIGRLIIVLFSLGIIPLTYYICYELTGKKEPSMYAAFLMTIMPLAVFFGRNIQPESPALFFIALSIYYYLKWTGDFVPKYLAVSLISLSMGALFKYTFMIFAIPLLFVFPFEKLRNNDYRKKLMGQILLIVICLSPLFLWALISKITNVGGGTLFTYERVHPFEIFSVAYWNNYYGAISGFLVSNFTMFYLGLAFIGLLLCLREIKKPFSRFCVGCALMAVPYSMILSDYIRQHSYYQMPFLLLISLTGAYALYQISEAKIVNFKSVKYLVIIGLVLLSVPAVKESIDQHYDRIFFGLDVAGDSINGLSNKDDRVYIAGHAQTAGMLWNADRYGAFLPSTLESFRSGEDERHIKWIFVYDESGVFDLRKNPEIWEYVANNYSVKEMGILKTGDTERQMYTIMEKGGSINTSKPNPESLTLRKKYETSSGEMEFYSLRAE
jgi:4-amino-4-deoxy-L-arabinose transferase-like glycosyltransferase